MKIGTHEDKEHLLDLLSYEAQGYNEMQVNNFKLLSKLEIMCTIFFSQVRFFPVDITISIIKLLKKTRKRSCERKRILKDVPILFVKTIFLSTEHDVLL